MTTPLVSVIIPCRNEAKTIRDCLQGVRDFEAGEGGFEILVVDGMSEDATRKIVEEIARQDARVRLIDNPERIASCALNRGIQDAQGEIILRIDAHTQYAPDYLYQCVTALRESGADCVGGPWIASGTGYVQECIAEAFNAPFAVGGARGHDPNYEGWVDTVYLGCWPRTVFDRIGRFDEELVRNQDDELSFRLIQAGGRIWQSVGIRSWYVPRASLHNLMRQYGQYGYWKVRVMQKRQAPASLRHLIPGLFVLTLLTLSMIAPWLSPAFWGLVGLSGLYGMALLAASIATSARGKWRFLPLFPVVFACYHLSYGFGFLLGVWDFVLRRRGTGRLTAVTRS